MTVSILTCKILNAQKRCKTDFPQALSIFSILGVCQRNYS